MDPALLSIALLVLLFLGSFVPRFSLALASLPAAFLVATVAGLSEEELFGFFPADLVVLILGITALFTVIKASGTTDWVLTRALRPLGNRTVLIPLMLFAIGAFITAIGTFPAAAIAVLAPVTLGIAAQRGLSPLLLCLSTLNGIMCGLFSPIAVFGATAPRLMAKAGIPVPGHTSLALFLSACGIGAILCAVIMLLAHRTHGTASRVHEAEADPTDGTTGSSTHTPKNPAADTTGIAVTEVKTPAPLALWSSAAALVTLIGAGAAFKINFGLLGLALALLLQQLLRLEPSPLIRRLPWEIVLLISGMLTYVAVMEHIGAFTKITEVLTIAGSPELSLLAVCFIVGLTSFFASSIAVIATAVPLIAPLVASGLSPVGAIVAVALSAVLVDVNPLGVTGGLLLGSAAAEHRERLFRHLMAYGLSAIVLGPLLAWGLFAWTL